MGLLNSFNPTLISILVIATYLFGFTFYVYSTNRNYRHKKQTLKETFYTVTYSFAVFGHESASKLSKPMKAMNGAIGLISIGMFTTVSYTSLQDYFTYRHRIENDKKVILILNEIHQDYVNVLSNIGCGELTIKPKIELSDIRRLNEKIYQQLIRETIPDLKSNYHPTSKDAFLANAEIIDKKISNLLAIGFETNYDTEIKNIAYMSRNFVNLFLWNYFKSSDFIHKEKTYIQSSFISGESNFQGAPVQVMINIQKELNSLRVKIYEDL